MRTDLCDLGRLNTGRCAVAVLAMLLAIQPAKGHDFWIEPQTFVAAAGSRLGFELKVGHLAQRMRSTLPASRVSRLEAVGGQSGAEPIAIVLQPGGRREDGWIPAMPAGRVLLALESDASAISRLDAARFNAYARDEGLIEVLAHREKGGRSLDAGTERYSRHAKTLVDGGCSGTDDHKVAQKVLGLKLEIVPIDDPIALPPGKPLGVRLLLEGKPMMGAQIRRVRLEATARPDEHRSTDAQGAAWFPHADAGHWMLAAVWSRPLSHPSPVTYETFFATFTFASRPSHRALAVDETGC